MEAEIITAYDKLDSVRILFQEYTDMLIQSDREFAAYLKIQNYEKELAGLNEKYAPPSGRLYIAQMGQKPVGCIALHALSDTVCEMKRLYVKPEFRGSKVGEGLVAKIIEDAKKIGYDFIVLDTVPFLKNAVKLYRKFGFYEISSYNNSPVTSSVFMRLDLN